MTDFPVTIDEVTALWVSEALGTAVSAVRATPVGTGQIGTCYSLELETPSGPGRVFAKLPAADPAARELVAGAYRSEVLFYRDIAEQVEISTPRCFTAQMRREGAEFVLLLEDLYPGTQGDQVAGCGPEQARAALVNLAGLHGPTWCRPDLPAWLHRNGPDDAAVLGEIYGQAMETFVDWFGARLSLEDVDVLGGLPGSVAGWILDRADRFAVVHGDYRLDNLVFGPRGVAAVDWQTLSVGLPARDLAFFLGTSLEPEERRRSERDLVAAYHEALVGHRVGDYGLDECWDDYRFALPQGPLIAVLGAVYGTRSERGDAMFCAMVRRACAALRDHA